MERFSRRVAAFAAVLVVMVAACSNNPAPQRANDGKVVSIGYGTQEKSNTTGAISSVSAEDVKFARYTRIEDLIEARVPGVRVVRGANGYLSLRIRGENTLTGNREPLIVIDGMPLSDFIASSALAAINPRDVERVDVLKDASAAIYGVRGANGVILITTRRR